MRAVRGKTGLSENSESQFIRPSSDRARRLGLALFYGYLSRGTARAAIGHPSAPRPVSRRLARLEVGDREAEAAAAPLVRLDPDPAMMALDDPLADREPDAAAGVGVAAVQALEYGEDPVGVLRVDPDAVVRDGEARRPTLALGRQVDPWRPLLDELDCVRDQVLEELAKLRLVAPDGR